MFSNPITGHNAGFIVVNKTDMNAKSCAPINDAELQLKIGAAAKDHGYHISNEFYCLDHPDHAAAMAVKLRAPLFAK